MTMRQTGVLIAALAGALGLVAACHSAAGSATVSGGHGTLNVQLTDAPLDLSNVTSVTVDITGVLVYPGATGMTGMDQDPNSPAGEGADETPIVLSTHPETFDLLTLTGGATDLLASGEVPDGFYQRIRLQISSATITFADGTSESLKIDSQKVDVPIGFHVSNGGTSSITLDFDAAASVQVNETATAKYILRPVVTPKAL